MYGDKIRLNAYHLLSSLGRPSSKIGDYIGPLICFAGFIPALTPMTVIISIYPRYIFYVNVPLLSR